MKTPVLESLFNRSLGPHVFSCEHYEIFKNTYFEEHLEWLRLYLHGSQRPAENLVK